ncbi:MAG: MFS transporter [Alphaproteobacteria bacterium]|nr:MFS transporter [Alphaproteobacteria bacterium]
MTAAVTALISRTVNARDDELRALLWSFAYFFFLLSSYYVLRPIRDEMGVAGGVENLQWLFTGTFVVMLAAVPLFGWIVARLPRRRFVPLVYRVFILCLLVFFALMSLDIGTVHVGRAFFIWVSVFNLFVVSVFWSVMADVFTNAQGRRLFGFIAAGGSAGALLGPTITATLAVPLGPVNLMLVSAVLLEAAVRCMRGAAGAAGASAREPAGAGATPPAPAIGGGVLAGLTHTLRSTYLSGIGGYIVLMTFAATVLYFLQAEIVAAASEDAGERTRIFAVIDIAANALTILLQLFVTGRFIRTFGVAAAAALLPAVVAAAFVALAAGSWLALPVVVLIAVVQAVRRATNYAISRPAREILFTVVPREEKYKAKNVIDTLVYRGGDAVSGWLYRWIAGTGIGLAGMAAIMVPVAALWLALALALGRRQDRLAETQAKAG